MDEANSSTNRSNSIFTPQRAANGGAPSQLDRTHVVASRRAMQIYLRTPTIYYLAISGPGWTERGRRGRCPDESRPLAATRGGNVDREASGACRVYTVEIYYDKGLTTAHQRQSQDSQISYVASHSCLRPSSDTIRYPVHLSSVFPGFVYPTLMLLTLLL